MSLPDTNDIIDDLAVFDDWEERYQYIIDLGRDLPPMDESLRTPERLVKGCQSNVWMEVDRDGDRIQFIVDSDAHIVRGLLAIVLAAFNNKTPQEIIDFDIDGYFNELDLESHLSPTRGNGLRAIVGRIRAIAEAAG
jgi:cysteine desulfuration protein SufE